MPLIPQAGSQRGHQIGRDIIAATHLLQVRQAGQDQPRSLSPHDKTVTQRQPLADPQHLAFEAIGKSLNPPLIARADIRSGNSHAARRPPQPSIQEGAEHEPRDIQQHGALGHGEATVRVRVFKSQLTQPYPYRPCGELTLRFVGHRLHQPGGSRVPKLILQQSRRAVNPRLAGKGPAEAVRSADAPRTSAAAPGLLPSSAMHRASLLLCHPPIFLAPGKWEQIPKHSLRKIEA